MTIDFFELFAGASGLSMGLEMGGLHCVGHAEIEPHACAVLRKKYPGIPLVGDVTVIGGAALRGITLLSGGSPCQDISVAGKRGGMTAGSGTRSSLFHEQVRIWKESDAPYILWENVLGAFSSNKGRDFAAVLSSIVGSPIAVPPGGWRSSGVAAGVAGVAAWRVLDAQYFGVPQRRRRVFVLGARAGGVDPAQVLSLGEGLSGDLEAGPETGEGAPGDAEAGARGGDEIVAVVPIQEIGKRQSGTPQNGVGYGEPGDPMYTLQAGAQHGVVAYDGLNQKASTVAPSLRIGKDSGDHVVAFDTKGTEVATGDDISPTLRAMQNTDSNANGGGQMGVVTFAPGNLSRGAGPVASETVFPPLSSEGHRGDMTPHVVTFKPAHYTRGKDGAPSTIAAPLAADADKGDQEQIVVAYQPHGQDSRISATETPTIHARAGTGGGNVPLVVEERVMPTLTTEVGKMAGHLHDEYVEAVMMSSGQANAEITEGVAPALTWLHEAPVVFGRERSDKYSEARVASTISQRDHKAATDIVVAPTITQGIGEGDGMDAPAAAQAILEARGEFPLVGRAEYGAGKPTLRASGGDVGGGSEMILAKPVIADAFSYGTSSDVAPTLDTGSAKGNRGPTLFVPDVSPTLHASDGGARLPDEQALPAAAGRPRRLMPVECERLMGWPDGHTAVGMLTAESCLEMIALERLETDGAPRIVDGTDRDETVDEVNERVSDAMKEIRRLERLLAKLTEAGGEIEYELSDSARYKLCGNGVASPVTAWIGHRLRAAILELESA